MLVPLAPRLLLLVLVSLQTHSILFLVPALELVNAFIPEDALVLVALSDAPPGVSQLLRTLGKHLLSPLLPLRRRSEVAGWRPAAILVLVASSCAKK